MKPLDHLDLCCVKLVFRDADFFGRLHGETYSFLREKNDAEKGCMFHKQKITKYSDKKTKRI